MTIHERVRKAVKEDLVNQQDQHTLWHKWGIRKGPDSPVFRDNPDPSKVVFDPVKALDFK